MTKSREKTPHLPAADWFAAGGFRTIVLAALTLIGIVLCALLAWPFIAPIAWALALAVCSVRFTHGCYSGSSVRT